jgi:hypothetical protein
MAITWYGSRVGCSNLYSLDKLLIISNESLDINIPNRA